MSWKRSPTSRMGIAIFGRAAFRSSICFCISWAKTLDPVRTEPASNTNALLLMLFIKLSRKVKDSSSFSDSCCEKKLSQHLHQAAESENQGNAPRSLRVAAFGQ